MTPHHAMYHAISERRQAKKHLLHGTCASPTHTRMCVYTSMFMCPYQRAYVHACKHTRTCIHISTNIKCACTHTHTYMYSHQHKHNVCMHTYTHVLVFESVCARHSRDEEGSKATRQPSAPKKGTHLPRKKPQCQVARRHSRRHPGHVPPV